MASINAYAALIEENIVREVIVIPYCNDDDADITAFCNGIGLDGVWIDTSYTGARRGKYAATGDTYNPLTDQFIAPTTEEGADNE